LQKDRLISRQTDMMTADNTSKVELLKYRQEDGQQSQVSRMTTDKTGRMGSNTVTGMKTGDRQTTQVELLKYSKQDVSRQG
jgi:5-hydroxyisourate hydrolase-like protein (transthyretin family)